MTSCRTAWRAFICSSLSVVPCTMLFHLSNMLRWKFTITRMDFVSRLSLCVLALVFLDAILWSVAQWLDVYPRIKLCQPIYLRLIQGGRVDDPLGALKQWKFTTRRKLHSLCSSMFSITTDVLTYMSSARIYTGVLVSHHELMVHHKLRCDWLFLHRWCILGMSCSLSMVLVTLECIGWNPFLHQLRHCSSLCGRICEVFLASPLYWWHLVLLCITHVWI